MNGLQKTEANARTPLREALVEAAVFAAAFAWLIYTMRHMLIFGNSTLVHDHIHGNYAPFQFLVEHLLDGRLPYWNPFSHGGKPAYPLIFHMRFFDPLVFLNIFLVSRFTTEIPVMLAWNAVLTQMVMVTGLYLLLRRVAANLWVRLCIIPVLVFSSVMLGAFRVPILLKMYVLLPYVTYFFLKIVYYRDYRWHNWLLFGALVGLNFQGVQILGPVMLIFFLFAGFVLFKREHVVDLIRGRGNFPKLFVSFAIVVLMVFPTLTVFTEKDGYIYPMRQLSKETGNYILFMQKGQELIPQDSIVLPYNTIRRTGTFATVWNFMEMIAPDGNRFLSWTYDTNWGRASEAFIYLGLLTWALGLLGIISGRHDLKKVVLFFMACFGLLIIGPPGGLHRALYYVFPPLWLIRHTHTFVPLFTFSFLFFFVLGLNRVYASWEGRVFPARQGQQGRAGQAAHTGLLRNAWFLCGTFVLFMAVVLSARFYRNDWLFVVLIFAMGAAYVLKARVGDKGVFLALTMAMVSGVMLHSPAKGAFLGNMAAFIALPGLAFYFLKYKKHVMGRLAGLALPLMFAVFATVLSADLALRVREFSFLYESQLNPRYKGIETTPQKPAFSRKRYVAPPTFLSSTNQPSRTSALMFRAPFVFSPLKTKGYALHNSFEDLLTLNFGKKQDRPLLPEPYSVFESASGPLRFVRKVKTSVQKPFVFYTNSAQKNELHSDTQAFTEALNAKRWNTFFYPKTYSRLINSDIPTPALMDIFAVGGGGAVGGGMIQFKEKAVAAQDEEAVALLEGLDGQQGQQAAVFLKANVFVAPKDTGTLPKSLLFDKSNTGAKGNTGVPGMDSATGFKYKVLSYDYSTLELEISAPKEGLLYWSDGYDPHWRAFVEGVETPVLRANLNFKAIQVPGGQSVVEFAFDHRRLRLSLLAFYLVGAASLLLGGALAFASSRESRRNQ